MVSFREGGDLSCHDTPSTNVRCVSAQNALAILLLFVIVFNPSNFYAPLYGAAKYGNSSICIYLGNHLWYFLRILIFVHFFAHKYLLTYSIIVRCAILFLFWFVYLLFVVYVS